MTSSQQEWIRMRSNSNKLIIKRHYLNPDSNVIRCTNCQTWSDSTTEQQTIAKFNKLFHDVEDYGYCFPSLGHFSVIFFSDTTELGKYFVDTLTIKGKARFSDASYQTSYSIDTREWNTFLKEYMNYR